MEIVHATVRGRAVGKGLVDASTSLAAYPTGKLLIVRQLFLHKIKLLLADDRWNLSDGSPLLLVRLGVSSSTSANGDQG
jgi:hypothetical protein